jgi:AcrR family transcriptional regulator
MGSSETRSEKRRREIIEGALACFMRVGYNNTTMDDIARESGVSKGTLYWYFESKDALFEVAVNSIFEDFGTEAFAALAGCESAEERLRVMADAAAQLGRRFQGYFSLFLEFWASSERREEAGRLWGDMLRGYKDIVVQIVEGGIENGEFQDVNAEELVWAVLAAYDGLAAYLMFIPDLDVEKISDVFIDTLLDGLKADRG